MIPDMGENGASHCLCVALTFEQNSEEWMDEIQLVKKIYSRLVVMLMSETEQENRTRT